MTSRLEPARAILCAIAIVSSAAAQQLTLTGTCASIGYSTVCCPPGANCRAMDGNCMCGADCHFQGDCCSDVQCPADARTCRDWGILSCCDETIAGTGHCDISNGTTVSDRCSCSMTCHERNDCCSDAESIGCAPRTCAQAGLGAGCCSRSSSACFVGGGNCYCDSYCVVFNDCCEDVPIPECPAANGNNARRSKVQSNLEPKNDVLSYAHSNKARYINSYAYSDRYARQREALIARAQRINTARKYRARVRTAVRRLSA